MTCFSSLLSGHWVLPKSPETKFLLFHCFNLWLCQLLFPVLHSNLEEEWSSFLKHAPHALPSLFSKQPLSIFSSLKGSQDLHGLVLSASLCLVLFRLAFLVISPCALPLAFFALICLHNRTSSDWMQALSHKEILPDSQFGHTPLKHAFMQLWPFIYDINVQLPTRL